METNKVDYQIWKDRWQALDQAMDQMKYSYKGPRRDTVEALLDGLEIFARQQLDFFLRFENGGLAESVQFPPEYALAVTLSQISHDLEVIQRAAQQRSVAKGGAGIQQELDTLNRADLLAWIALQPAINKDILVPFQFSGDGSKNDLKMSVLTYFNKVPQIRVMPYANIAVIGIPYSSTKVPMDFLAIPHEVGHVVFWRQDTPLLAKESIQDQLEPKYRRWWEEIFADVYGCLVAGPVIVFDFQELSRQHPSAEFLRVDDEHPSPYLRPRIYAKVLNAQGDLQMAKKLDARWKKIAEHGDLGLRRMLNEAIGPELSLDVHKPVDFMIREALDILKPIKGLSPEQAVWTPKISQVEQLGKSFNDRQILKILDAASSSPPDLTPVRSASVTPTPFNKKELVMTEAASWKEWVKNRLKVDLEKVDLEQAKIHVDDWKRVLQSDGWTEGGPQNDPAH